MAGQHRAQRGAPTGYVMEARDPDPALPEAARTWDENWNEQDWAALRHPSGREPHQSDEQVLAAVLNDPPQEPPAPVPPEGPAPSPRPRKAYCRTCEFAVLACHCGLTPEQMGWLVSTMALLHPAWPDGRCGCGDPRCGVRTSLERMYRYYEPEPAQGQYR